jgi:hypothetical protein
MSKIEALNANSGDSPDWNRAWTLVSRLATARGATLPQARDTPAMRQEPQEPAIPAPRAPLAPDQLARDMAEIEQAAAALRRAEPALQPRRAELDAMPEVRGVRSVWILIALIWLSAASVVSCAIGAVLLFLG